MKYARYILLVGLITVLAAGTAQSAAYLIDGKRLIKRSVPGSKITPGTITTAQLSPGVKKLLRAKSTNTTFAEGGSIPGATGAAGAAGANGSSGAKGDSGAAGSDGATGSNGANGADGSNGANGADGENGTGRPTLVNATSLRGWTLAPKGDNEDVTDNGTIGFDTPPVAPGLNPATPDHTSILGTKALKMTTNATGKSVVAFLPLPIGNDNPLLSELTIAGYSTLVHQPPSNGGANSDVSFQLEVIGSTSTAFPNGYTTVVFDPALQPGTAAVPNAWHRHYISSGKSVWGSVYSTKYATSAHPTQCSLNLGSPCSLATFIEQNPNARVTSAKLRIGQNNGAAWANFEGFVDDVRLGFDTTAQRYDLGG